MEETEHFNQPRHQAIKNNLAVITLKIHSSKQIKNKDQNRKLKIQFTNGLMTIMLMIVPS